MKHKLSKKVIAIILAVAVLIPSSIVVANAIDPSECSHSDTKWITVTEPDCSAETNGLAQKICNDCGTVLDEDVLNWEYSHDFSGKVWDVSPTCTVKGEYHEKCTKCGNSDGTHSRGCSRCQYVETANCTYTATVTAPTCTEGGYTTYVCDVCGYTYVDDFTDALGHDWGEWKDDENGESHTRTCARCGETETDSHDFTCWQYNKDGKVLKNGTKSRYCTICGCVETDVAHHTSLVCRIFYPLLHWVDEIIGKTFFIASLKWFLPFLNLKIEI